MDPVVAARLASELLGREVGGWLVLDYVNCGKSALVMRGERQGSVAALKIFDPDLVQRFGRDTQLARIQRETLLAGKNHPNLVSIYDGGECHATGYLFVAMEFVDAPNLATALPTLPRDRIRAIISQVAAAAEYLESLGMVHRDIKPENVVVTEGWARTILLDLGVLRPISGSDLTDETNSKPFIGTLRYAAPEYLLRDTDDSVESWRALTFYQLGAVLHDLIMRRPLFSEYSEPYARLVQAVIYSAPTVNSSDIDPELISLARDCLVKLPAHRLRFVSWERFQFRSSNVGSVITSREKLARRRAIIVESPPEVMTERARLILRKDTTNQLTAIVRQLCVSNPDIPPVEVHGITTDTAAECEAVFPKVTSFGLDQVVRVRLVLQIVDYADVSVGLSVVGWAGTPEGEQISVNLFEGVMELERVRAEVDGAICDALVRAQEGFERGDRDFIISIHGRGA